jgi:hypothetical protein
VEQVGPLVGDGRLSIVKVLIDGALLRAVNFIPSRACRRKMGWPS